MDIRLTPTARHLLSIIRAAEADTKLTLTYLTFAVGASVLTVQRTASKLCNAGLVIRHKVAGVTHYTAAPATENKAA